ncbi:MAG: acyl carrier protein [Saprospiraceae bacterium]|nr:acyl carrier protein [Saprospiraceae bacterium]
MLEILSDVRPDLDFENEKSLVSDGNLDSFDIVTIISELNDAFNIKIKVQDLIPANFNSLEAIHNLVVRLREIEK